MNALLFILLLAACGWYFARTTPSQHTKNKAEKPPPTPLETALAAFFGLQIAENLGEKEIHPPKEADDIEPYCESEGIESALGERLEVLDSILNEFPFE